jgi:hypothetical protein
MAMDVMHSLLLSWHHMVWLSHFLQLGFIPFMLHYTVTPMTAKERQGSHATRPLSLHHHESLTSSKCYELAFREVGICMPCFSVCGAGFQASTTCSSIVVSHPICGQHMASEASGWQVQLEKLCSGKSLENVCSTKDTSSSDEQD